MHKISTIFERDMKNGGRITRQLSEYVKDFPFSTSKATEKLDGTNVRLTVRNHILVRLEKRRNPDNIQKHKGIIDPWYVDASEYEAQDKYIWEAAHNTDLSNVPDGEWSGEAIGPKIQGNPLHLDEHIVVLFTLGEAPEFKDVPLGYDELKEWLPRQQSKYGMECGIEGVVWHAPDGRMAKIKTKDFI